MILESVTKLENKKHATSNIFDGDVMWVNCGVIILFLFMANFQPSGSQILDICNKQ